jgi:5-oxoprolinase (ATP-hydrolysing)
LTATFNCQSVLLCRGAARANVGAHGDFDSTVERNYKEELVAYQRGPRFLSFYGYRYTAHEVAAKRIAEEIGFTQISVPRMNQPNDVARQPSDDIDRGQIAIGPILRRYVVQGCRRNAGRQAVLRSPALTGCPRLQGQGWTLSGPAGGIVGMYSYRRHGQH